MYHKLQNKSRAIAEHTNGHQISFKEYLRVMLCNNTIIEISRDNFRTPRVSGRFYMAKCSIEIYNSLSMMAKESWAVTMGVFSHSWMTRVKFVIDKFQRK